MSTTKKATKTITFPIAVFQTASSKSDLENWLLAHNPSFIKRMRKSREDDLQGKGKSWKEFKKEICIK